MLSCTFAGMYGKYAHTVQAEADATGNPHDALSECERYISGTVNVLDCDLYRLDNPDNKCALSSACQGYFATNYGNVSKPALCPLPIPQCYHDLRHAGGGAFEHHGGLAKCVHSNLCHDIDGDEKVEVCEKVIQAQRDSHRP